jgi:hypothetical protein
VEFVPVNFPQKQTALTFAMFFHRAWLPTCDTNPGQTFGAVDFVSENSPERNTLVLALFFYLS